MVDVINFTRTKLPNTVTTSVKQALKKHGIGDNVEIELRLVGLQRMRTLNRQYRGKDYATDVLSFPIWPNLATIKQQSKQGPILLGSIVICLPIAIRQAQKERQPAKQQVDSLIEHSVKHLLGFHHKGD